MLPKLLPTSRRLRVTAERRERVHRMSGNNAGNQTHADERERVARALWETFFHKPNQDDEAWEAMRLVYLAKADEFLARVTLPVHS